MIFWLYGRSGAGKTSLATDLEKRFAADGLKVFLLDGDELRTGLCKDLGFTPEARTENHRRVAELARLIARRGFLVIAATMAPEVTQRDVIHQVLGKGVRWIYVDAPIGVCVRRDPKGLYALGVQGGSNSIRTYPFDPPRSHELHLHLPTDQMTLEQAADCLKKYCDRVLAEQTDPLL